MGWNMITGIIIVMVFLCVCTYMDLKSKYINIYICLAFGVIGMLYKSCIVKSSLMSVGLALFPGIFVMIISLLSKESIGKGDAMVVGIMGLYVGGINTILALFYGVILASIIGIICMIFMKKSGQHRMPFVPFMAIGLLLQMVNGGII